MTRPARKRYFLAIFLLLLFLPGETRGAAVRFTRQGDQVNVSIAGRPFSTYYFGASSPKPYLHPLRTARGSVVTRAYPMEQDRSGEDRDHPHHRALYFAHGNINGVDFWSEAQFPHGELPIGRTVFRKIAVIEGGPQSGRLGANFDLVGPDGAVIAEETQLYVFRGNRKTRILDCEFTIRASHGAVKMEDTKEGTFAIRVVKALAAPAGQMLNSENKSGETAIWGKRAKWVDYSGEVNGEKAGIAIFDHPSNPKHPTYWMARGYGLLAANPFGERDFYGDRARDGSVTIPAGGTMTLRYRVLIHHGRLRAANIAKAYAAYSAR